MTDVTGGTGRRERKKHATYVALHDAALRLFAEKGFVETTVEDISDAADVATRTFFRHFGSKEAVVFADDDDRRESLVAALEARPAGEPILVTVREAAFVVADSYTPEKDFFRYRLAMQHGSIGRRRLEIGVQWERDLAEEVARRLNLPSRYDVTARTVAAAAMGAWRVGQANWVRDEGRHTLRHHLAAPFDVLAALGTLTPPVVDVRDVPDVEPVLTDRSPREVR